MTQSEYNLDFFKNNDFKRRKCKSCNRHFWTQSDKEICGEPPCEEYTFIGRSLMNKKLNLHEMREAYLSFFERNGHTRIARYPITARWRDDVFFTQASIYDFQPWVINRTVEPPANPLTISQTCVRFNDIDNVGKTGRHFTMFEMMAHHAFNTPGNEIYFKERTLELCHNLLTKDLGIDPIEISYIEDAWAGGGNSGPCFETMVGGVELATLVFMMYEETPAGKKKMDMQVVDTGYGLERFAWMSQGTSSAYEAVFGSVLEKLKKESGVQTASDDKILGEYSKVAGFLNVETEGDLRELRKKVADRLNITVPELEKHTNPSENLYAICDHTRALMFMLNDGVVPSNVKQGYFARLLVRRTMRALKSLNLSIPISEITGMQIDYFKNDFPDVSENKCEILNLINIEEEKYKNTIKRGRGIVKRVECDILKKGGNKLGINDLIDLYDSHGLIPLAVKDFASLGVEIPDDFYIRVAAKHEGTEIEAEEKVAVPGDISDTELKYYKIVSQFSARVLKIDYENNYIILDRTHFYPEGGGQEADTGRIGNARVVDVQKINSVVIHKFKIKENIKINFSEGEDVECEIDFNRRKQLTQNHTATHIINGAARKVLGNHIWQSGAHKSEDIARLDVTHYASLTDFETEEIERQANRIIAENRKIEIFTLPRNEAEKRYGFRLYQGGAVPGRDIRIVDIKNWDTEACGGTHCAGDRFTGKTGDVEVIKLIRSKRIQDGVVRLEFVAGEAARRNIRKQEELFENSLAPMQEYSGLKIEIPLDSYNVTRELKGSADALSVPLEQLAKTTLRFAGECKKAREEIKELEGDIPESKLKNAKTLSDACKILFEEWKLLGKEVEKLKKNLKNNVYENLNEKFKTNNFVKYIAHGLPVKDAISLAKEFTEGKNRILILINVSGGKANVVCASSNPEVNAGDAVRKISNKLGGGGHGDVKLGVGGGKAKGVEKVLEGFEI
ncbi:hypothetical protein BEH94_09955 [Candidatus Altiarchaeales archaeon WOR_SM1_SCG]|nr:hypothetical protein BEH94_09955 [Candidatus Altiarchaeales archaeon WOR_SM1_SCG]